MNRLIFIVVAVTTTVTLAQLSLVKDQECKENESYQTCGTACEPSCDNPSPLFCTLQCVLGCFCDTGYVRNSEKKCVKREECSLASNETTVKNVRSVTPTVSTSLSCSVNETANECHNPCTEQKCPVYPEVMVNCLMMCQVGCSCKEGYVRNTQGVCVLTNDCPPVSNGTTSENPCNLVDCRSGKVCKVENNRGVCVDVIPRVPVIGGRTCATMLCRNGFVCKTNKNGRAQCVEAEDDTPTMTCATVRCGTPGGCQMVEPSSCGSSGKCKLQPMCIHENGCASLSCLTGSECVLQQVVCIKAPCNPIAKCVDKKSENNNNGCGKNEVFSGCTNACSDRKCNDKGDMACITMCQGEGCVCDTGFYRNSLGKCVTQNECDIESSENNSSLILPILDEASNETNLSCLNVTCPTGEVCEQALVKCSSVPCPVYVSCVPQGFLSNETTLGCASVTCPVGESCEEVQIGCETENCAPYVSCVPNNESSNSTVTQGCDVVTCMEDEFCEEKVEQCFRAPCPSVVSCVKVIINTNSTASGNGTLIDDINSQCSLNETWAECTNICNEDSCQVKMSDICPLSCKSGCTCAHGFKRNQTGYCVEPKDCSNNTSSPVVVVGQCNLNETLRSCHNSCNERKCPGTESTMFCTSRCHEGCGCMEGYYRSSDGNCYTLNDCPLELTCGRNEDYRCKGCNPTCQNPDPKCDSKKCEKSCQCAEGFVRYKGKCVTFANCPKHTHDNVTCLATEDYTDCLPKCYISCTGNQVCDNSISSSKCTPGCVCTSKYKRDTNGECVHNRLCYKHTDCPDNEEWAKCQDNESTCAAALGKTTAAPTKDTCFSGCSCSQGFFRSSNGTCVTFDKC